MGQPLLKSIGGDGEVRGSGESHYIGTPSVVHRDATGGLVTFATEISRVDSVAGGVELRDESVAGVPRNAGASVRLLNCIGGYRKIGGKGPSADPKRTK